MAGEIGTWYHRVSTKSDNTGTQIDLVIDRNDNAIKYSSNIFTIDKNY